MCWNHFSTSSTDFKPWLSIDLSNSNPYDFQRLSPPAYVLAVFSVIEVFFNICSIISSSVLIVPDLISLNTALSSEATTFSSHTPCLISFSTWLLNAVSSIPLPDLYISLKTNLIESPRLALKPMCPANVANKVPAVTLRTWVWGEYKVLPACTIALGLSIQFL